jgi:hypothetical protein
MAAPDLEDFHALLSRREALGVVGDAAERSLARYTPTWLPRLMMILRSSRSVRG